MPSFTRNLIEYSGEQLKIKSNCKPNSTFKQSTIDINFCLNECKNKIKDILRANIDTKIQEVKVVKTAVGTSVEGQTLTGNKLMIIGEFTLKTTYVTDTTDYKVESYTVSIPFSDYIVLPSSFVNLTFIKPEIYIEDMYIKNIDDKCIFGNITYLVQAEIC